MLVFSGETKNREVEGKGGGERVWKDLNNTHMLPFFEGTTSIIITILLESHLSHELFGRDFFIVLQQHKTRRTVLCDLTWLDL